MHISLVEGPKSVRENLSTDELLDLAKSRPFVAPVWVDIAEPKEEELLPIANALGVHHMTTRDCLSRLVPVKWELFEDHLYVVAHGLNFNAGDDLLETLNLSILVFDDLCLTVHTRPLRSVANLRRDFAEGRPSARLEHPDRILHSLLDTVSLAYGALVEEVSAIVEELDDAVLEGRNLPDMLHRLSNARRHLAVLRRRMSPMREMLQQISLREAAQIHEDTRVYLRDTLDSVVRNLEKSDVVRETLTAAQANYLAQLANQTNEVMKTLSLVATVMLPLSFLTGLFGMNVHVPGQDGDGLLWFGGLLGSMIALALALIFLFKKRGWL